MLVVKPQQFGPMGPSTSQVPHPSCEQSELGNLTRQNTPFWWICYPLGVWTPHPHFSIPHPLPSEHCTYILLAIFLGRLWKSISFWQVGSWAIDSLDWIWVCPSVPGLAHFHFERWFIIFAQRQSRPSGVSLFSISLNLGFCWLRGASKVWLIIIVNNIVIKWKVSALTHKT